MNKFLALFLVVMGQTAYSIPAFPGAEGWGADATGGRGGQVVHVANLNPYGTGSLDAALKVGGSKIIVFDVGGVIDLQNGVLTLPSNTTVAGQTAPGGITLKNGGLYTQYGGSTTNIIIRCLRMRRSQDAADGDCMRFTGATNFIVDHCSMMWNSDETLDLSYRTHSGTFQYCIIAEPGYCSGYYCGDVGCGNGQTLILAVGLEGGMTLYRNLLAHSAKRTPFFSNDGTTPWQGKTFELVNNLFYDDFQGGYESFDNNNTIPLNLIGNYYKPGPNAAYPSSQPYAHSGTVPAKMIAHVSENYHAQYPTIKVPAGFFNSRSVIAYIDTMIPPQKTFRITTAHGAYDDVLASAGPFPRDAADARVTGEVKTATGGWMTACAARSDALLTGGGTRPTDGDNDGMPDAWESAHGLNPAVKDNTTKMNGGYDAIEVYINGLVDSMAPSVASEGAPLSVRGGGIPVQARPNPFRTGVAFRLTKPGRMSVYGLSGKLVHSSGTSKNARDHFWNGRDNAGWPAAPGIYIARFTTVNGTVEKRVSLIR